MGESPLYSLGDSNWQLQDWRWRVLTTRATLNPVCPSVLFVSWFRETRFYSEVYSYHLPTWLNLQDKVLYVNHLKAAYDFKHKGKTASWFPFIQSQHRSNSMGKGWLKTELLSIQTSSKFWTIPRLSSSLYRGTFQILFNHENICLFITKHQLMICLECAGYLSLFLLKYRMEDNKLVSWWQSSCSQTNYQITQWNYCWLAKMLLSITLTTRLKNIIIIANIGNQK